MLLARSPIGRACGRFACVLAVRLFAIVLSASIITARIAAAADPMGFDEARHLLNRTSFAANVEDIQAFAALTRTQAVKPLLAWTATTKVSTPAPAWVNEFESPRWLRGLSEEERKLALRAQAENGAELRSWWLTEMLTTRSPLTEKMVLFWHNHFASSLQKVRSGVLMYRQNLLLRKTRSATRPLLHAVAKDPAMVVYLDNASNRKAQPTRTSRAK